MKKEELKAKVRKEYAETVEFYRTEINKISKKIGEEKCNDLIVKWVFDNIGGIHHHLFDYLTNYVQEND